MSDDDLFAIAEFDVDALLAERVTARSVISLPDPILRVIEAIADGASLPTITKMVEADPELSANVARLAKSAAFTGAVGDKVSVPYAIMRLGKEGVRCVCLTLALANVALRAGPLLQLRKRVWRECLASAVTCQAIASFRKVSADDAYLLGLLHDFGKIVALSAMEADLAADATPSDDAFWIDVMERHHCDVGWIMADTWRLPEPVSTITATHHQPALDDEPLRHVLMLVDEIVARASDQRWQISAEEIEQMRGVRSRDEAMALRIGLAKHPYYFTSIG